MRHHLLAAAACCLAGASALPSHPPLISPALAVASYSRLAVDAATNSSLWAVSAQPLQWELGDALLLDLRGGSRRAQGGAYARLLGPRASAAVASLFGVLLPNATTRALVGRFLDWQWSAFLAPALPAEFAEEVAGVADEDAPLWASLARLLALAVGPADADNWRAMIDAELAGGAASPLTPAELDAVVYALGHLGGAGGWRTCDMMAAWGRRTDGGGLLATRNLDWVVDSGVSVSKLVTVYHPPEPGRAAHATVGFAGFVGAIAGMSARGVTVSQSNLDNSRVLLNASAWPFRLRYIMETADTVADVRAVYSTGALAATAGTANHIVGCQSDAAAGRTAAVAAECIAPVNALYADDDPAEAAAVDPATGARIGFPLPHALFRSNHALSARILPTQVPLWNDTLQRYNMLRQFILDAEPGTMNETYAVQIAATLGQKGDDYYACAPASFSSGDNVISVAYNPARARLYAAWEDVTAADGWTPACCTFYTRFDLGEWFAA